MNAKRPGTDDKKSGLDKLAQIRSNEANAIVASYIKRMAGDEEIEILEAGCGKRWPIELDGVRYRLQGIDLDEDALRLRKERFDDLDETLIEDLREVRLPAASFDVVYSSFVLEHIEGAERVLRRFATWLKPGGLLILKIPDRDSAYSFVARMTPFWVHVLYYRWLRGMRNAGKPGFGPYPTFYDRVVSRKGIRRFARESRLQLLEECGFAVLPPGQKAFLQTLSVLSLRRLAGDYVNLLVILRRPDEATELGTL